MASWTVGVFDRGGNQIADISSQAFDDKMTRVLNGIDTYDFSLYLDDPVSGVVDPIKTVVKVWRAGRPRAFPNFAGIVGARTRSAASNIATYTAYSPYWRLRMRHHIDPHDWTLETGRGKVGLADDPINQAYNRGSDPSEIMWQMIEWTSTLIAYTPGDGVGLVKGGFADYSSANPSVLINIKYDRGQNTWDLIQDIVTLPGFPDLDGTYFHEDGNPDMMYFNTTTFKGLDRGLSLDYRTGQKNLADISETMSAEPGSYANYVVVQGQGDTDADQTIERADGATRYVDGSIAWANGPDPTHPIVTWQGGATWTPPDLITEYGLYMLWEKLQEPSTPESRRQRALYLLREKMYPPYTYEPTLTPTVDWGFGSDFDVGDMVTINIDRGTWQVYGKKRRIIEASVSRSANNVETPTFTLAENYKEFE